MNDAPYALAFHEAGHATVAHAVGFTLDDITVDRENMAGLVSFSFVEWSGATRSLLSVNAAGRLGEIQGLGRDGGRSDDDEAKARALLEGFPASEHGVLMREAARRAAAYLRFEKGLFEALAERLYRGLDWREAFTNGEAVVRLPYRISER